MKRFPITCYRREPFRRDASQGVELGVPGIQSIRDTCRGVQTGVSVPDVASGGEQVQPPSQVGRAGKMMGIRRQR